MKHEDNSQQGTKKIATVAVGASLITFALFYGIMVFVIPKYQVIFEDLRVDIPITTQLLLAAAGWVTSNWYIVIFSPVVFIVAWMTFLNQHKHIKEP